MMPTRREVADAIGMLCTFTRMLRLMRSEATVARHAAVDAFIEQARREHPTVHIGRPGFERSYLERTILGENPLCSLVLHRFRRQDVDPPHDHSFDFASIVLVGVYREERWDRRWYAEAVPEGPCEIKRYQAGSVLYRRAQTVHRVQPVRGAGDAWSLVLRGPKRREWSFFPETHGDPNMRRAVPWKAFLGVSADDGDLLPAGGTA